jgi:hypothetical protein
VGSSLAHKLVNGRESLARRGTMMDTHKVSELEIKVRIVPKRARWPEAHVSPAWTKARHCVDMFEELVRDVDCNCLEAEQNKKLSTRELRESRAVICNQAIGKLSLRGRGESAI